MNIDWNNIIVQFESFGRCKNQLLLIIAAQNQNKIKFQFDMGDTGMIHQNQLTTGSMASNMHI